MDTRPRILRFVEQRSPARFLGALLVPAAATGLGITIGQTRTTAAALLYLLGILIVATAGGLGAGILASILSFLGLNFFFTSPRHTFSVGRSDDLIALVVFLTVGVVVSTLVSAGLAQRARAQRREYEARSLYAISTQLSAEDGDAAPLGELAEHLRSLLGLARAEVLVRDEGGALELRAQSGSAIAVEPTVIPLATGEHDVGLMRLYPLDHRRFDEPERRVAVILAQQIAAALVRARLENEAREAKVAAETNRVRRALLSAVSHDFRTPLSSIKAAISALRVSPPTLTGSDRNELLQTALEETERLEDLVSNLLDLTRLRSGALAPDRVATSVEEILEGAVAAVRLPLAHHRVSLSVRDDTPRLFVDVVQVGQVLRNVLENAAKFSPAGSEIRIAAVPWQGWVEVRVTDRGAGIAPGERESVFDEFYRAGDARIAGTGLGLAVAKAVVRAHGGEIWIEGTPGGGTTVAMRLPADAAG